MGDTQAHLTPAPLITVACLTLLNMHRARRARQTSPSMVYLNTARRMAPPTSAFELLQVALKLVYGLLF